MNDCKRWEVHRIKLVYRRGSEEFMATLSIRDGQSIIDGMADFVGIFEADNGFDAIKQARQWWNKNMLNYDEAV